MKCGTEKMNTSCCTTSVCGDSKTSGRKFLTTDEKIAKLGDYREWLDNEAKGVDETIKELKRAN